MRILLTEDDVRIAREIAATLHAAGYVIDTVNDGEEAWFRGETEDYDLIILDLGLPRIDGLTVLKRWRASGRVVPVLILTARGSWPERVEGINAGVEDYLPKPFQMEEMLARVRALIRRSVGPNNRRYARDACHAQWYPDAPFATRVSAFIISQASQGKNCVWAGAARASLRRGGKP